MKKLKKKPKPCWCSGYWFPHRTKSGACEHNPNRMAAAKILAKRHSLSSEETMELLVELAWETPGIVTVHCPF